MSWYPGDSRQGQPPFGDFERQAERVRRFVRDKLPRVRRRVWLWFVLVIVAVILVATSVYTVPVGHQGVVLRFGRFVGKADPGLHLKLPFGMDRVRVVRTEKVDTESFGFRTTHAGIRSRFERTEATRRESLMLTGDLNVIDVEWIVQFRREDPRHFLFSVRQPVQAIRDVSESVIRRIVGDWSFDYVLQNREEVNNLARDELQTVLDEYESGIRIVNVRLENAVPPDPVKDAFNHVSEAQQEKERLINQAQETYNKQIPKARGEAEKTINIARGEALERVNRAEGDVARFREVLKEYRKASDVTRRRLYIETMQEVLPRARQIYVVDEEQKSILPLLQLDRQEGRASR
jgi:membrane protease subunit HflK